MKRDFWLVGILFEIFKFSYVGRIHKEKKNIFSFYDDAFV